jgi:hypothetical protein
MCTKGTFPPPRRERPLRHNVDLEDNVPEMDERSLTTSVRGVSDRVASRMQVWRTVHDFGMYPFHLWTDLALWPTNYNARL